MALVRTYQGRTSRRTTPLSDGELIKYKEHANKLERDQRRRFRASSDPYNFFSSTFEKEVFYEIADRRQWVARQLEEKAELAKQKQQCHCDDINCPYQYG